MSSIKNYNIHNFQDYGPLPNQLSDNHVDRLSTSNETSSYAKNQSLIGQSIKKYGLIYNGNSK